MSSPEKPPEASAESYILGGQVRLRQPLRGHRVGTDAVLLAACLPHTAQGVVLDIGAGVGAVGLAAAVRAAAVSVHLVERDAGQAEFALGNIALNGLQGRASVTIVDVLDAKSRRAVGLQDRMANTILTNPPFYKTGTVRASPEPLKSEAYAMEASLDDWLRACAALLAPKGTLYMVHLGSALAQILDATGSRFGDVQIIPVYSKPEEPAGRVLVRATKGSRAPPSILPGIIMHDDAGYSAQGEAILRGRASICFHKT